MRFENPANGYVEEVTNAPLWCLLFGCIYFAMRGVWTHAVAALLLAIFTLGISWLIYPFYENQIMRTHYLRRGWLEFGGGGVELYIENRAPRGSHYFRKVLITVLLGFVAISIAATWLARTENKTDQATTAPLISAPIPTIPAPTVLAPAVSRKPIVAATGDVPKADRRDRNVANKRLMALSEADRRTFLYVILNMSKEPCAEATRTFYKGSAKPSWNAIWNVACRGGPSYSILIFSDEKGSSKVMTCGELRSVGGGECFARTE